MPRLRLSKNPLSVFSSGAGFAMGTAAAPALRPILQSEINRVWALHPSRPLDAETAALAEIVAGWTPTHVLTESEQTGTNETRANALRAMAGTAPGIAQLLALRNRGIVTDDEVKRGLRQLMIRAEWHDEILALRIGVLDASTAAGLVAKGLLSNGAGQTIANRTGVSDDNFNRMVDAAAQTPTVGQVLEWGNRERKSDAEVAGALEATGLRDDWRGRVAHLRRYLVPPSDLIRMAVREVFSHPLRELLTLDEDFPAEFATKAEQLGMDEQTAKDYWAAHWELPSPGQGADMMFRGGLTPAQYKDLLRALDIAPFWRPYFEKIAHRIPTVSDFQRLVRREVYNDKQRTELELDAEYPAEFTKKMALHGLSEDDAKDLWAGGWRLPSASQGYKMLWRKKIEAPKLRDLLKALDYAPTWRQPLMDIARPTLGRIDLRRLYAEGVITAAEVLEGYELLGYTDQHARWLTNFAVKTARGTEKEATAGDELTLYNGQRIDRPTLITRLEALGYDQTDAVRKADVLDARRVVTALGYATNATRDAFVKHGASEAATRTRLAQIGVPVWAQDEMIDAWQVARIAAAPDLTLGQIQRAYSRSILSQADAQAALAAQGWSDDEARVLLGISDAALTVKQVQDAYKGGLRTLDEALRLLAALRFSESDARLVLGEAGAGTGELQIQAEMRAGTISRDEAVARLVALGYSVAAANAFLDFTG